MPKRRSWPWCRGSGVLASLWCLCNTKPVIPQSSSLLFNVSAQAKRPRAPQAPETSPQVLSPFLCPVSLNCNLIARKLETQLSCQTGGGGLENGRCHGPLHRREQNNQAKHRPNNFILITNAQPNRNATRAILRNETYTRGRPGDTPTRSKNETISQKASNGAKPTSLH